MCFLRAARAASSASPCLNKYSFGHLSRVTFSVKCGPNTPSLKYGANAFLTSPSSSSELPQKLAPELFAVPGLLKTPSPPLSRDKNTSTLVLLASGLRMFCTLLSISSRDSWPRMQTAAPRPGALAASAAGSTEVEIVRGGGIGSSASPRGERARRAEASAEGARHAHGGGGGERGGRPPPCRCRAGRRPRAAPAWPSRGAIHRPPPCLLVRVASSGAPVCPVASRSASDPRRIRVECASKGCRATGQERPPEDAKGPADYPDLRHPSRAGA
ncbi:unnamed protein product [Prorocentrum cordatum]|uniref:Uncharacterized protein n=1 Tax=Prorocentrum cordatum TaxID=2364126 RepID=A0ABN9V001_9DINO|nr:unnamed protein product [Polarella glacialis]